MGDISLESDEKCESKTKKNKNTRSDVSYRIGRPATFQAIEQESKFKANDTKKVFSIFFLYFNLSSSVSTSYRNSSLLVCSAGLALLPNGIFDFNNIFFSLKCNECFGDACISMFDTFTSAQRTKQKKTQQKYE